MMPVSAPNPSAAGSPGRTRKRIASGLVHASLIVILTVCITRLFLPETPIRSGLIPLSEAVQLRGNAQLLSQEEAIPRTDRIDLARASFAVLLMAGGLMGLVGLAMLDQWKPAWTLILWLVLCFAVSAWISGLSGRADPATASLAWADAVAPMLAGAAMVALCSNRRRFALLVGVLSAAGIVLAILCIWQRTVEIPQNIAQLKADEVRLLQQVGYEPGSREAQQFQARITDKAPTGRFGLANLLASALLILTGLTIGLVLDRFQAAWRTRKAFRLRSPKGEVHPATLLAVLTALAGGAMLCVIVLTESLGAIASAALGALAMAGIWRFRQRLSRRWKLAVGLTGALFALALAGVVGYGLARDRLPTKTMTFRWHYWQGGMSALSERPLLGAGPGGFAQAYLQHRRPQAEEDVKTAHNVIIQSLTEYGWIGGSLRLVVLISAMVLLAKPRHRVPWKASDASPGTGFVKIITGAGVVLGLGALHAWLGTGQSLLYAGGLALLLVNSLWRIDRNRLAGVRVGLAVGLAAMILHNMVTFSLTWPATGTLFWICAGACIGFARRGSWGSGIAAKQTGRLRITGRDATVGLAMLALAVPLAVTIVQIWAPAYRKTHLLDQAIRKYVRNQQAACMDLLQDAVDISGDRDELLRYDASRMAVTWVNRFYDRQGREQMVKAYQMLRDATGSARNASWAGMLAFDIGSRDFHLMRWPESAGAAPIRLRQIQKSLTQEDSFSPATMAALAGAYYQLEQYDQAIGQLDLLLSRVPGCVTARLRRGDAAWLAGKKDQARRDWQQATQAIQAETSIQGPGVQELPPGQALPDWMNKGLAHWADAIRLNPQDATMRMDYARTLARRGMCSQALEQIQRARQRNRSLDSDSLHRFTEYQQAQADVLEARCRYLAGSPGRTSEQ